MVDGLGGTLDKAQALLSAIARSEDGARLTDLARSCAIAAPSAHRLLAELERAHLVTRGREDRRYRVGEGLMALAAAAWRQFPLTTIAEPILAALSRETGASSYLSVASGLDALCLMRIDGPGRVRTLVMDAGTRRPLGIGAGSLALLTRMPLEEAERLVRANAERPSDPEGPDYDARVVLAAREAAMRVGFAVHDGTFIPGLHGLGAASRVAGRPVAISLSFVGGLTDAATHRQFHDRLGAAIEALERSVRSFGATPRRPRGETSKRETRP